MFGLDSVESGSFIQSWFLGVMFFKLRPLNSKKNL